MEILPRPSPLGKVDCPKARRMRFSCKIKPSPDILPLFQGIMENDLIAVFRLI